MEIKGLELPLLPVLQDYFYRIILFPPAPADFILTGHVDSLWSAVCDRSIVMTGPSLDVMDCRQTGTPRTLCQL